MIRLVWILAAMTSSACGNAAGQDPTAAKLRSEILNCRLTTGPWKGAFKDNRDAAGFRYYFVSNGLRAVVKEALFFPAIEAYLDHCLARANPKTGLWDDVPNSKLAGTKITDADDSNAAMLILLAADFAQTSQGNSWWKINSEKLKAIAQLVLLDNRLPSGLVRVFSLQRKVDDPKYEPDPNGFRLALQQSAYLMDSCEVYAAFYSLGTRLEVAGDQDSAKYKLAARSMADAIASLYHYDTGAFYMLENDRNAFPNFYPANRIAFYPHRFGQVFPELFDVPLGSEEETARRYKTAWAFATAKGDWNAGLPKDGSSDGFPAMARALIALKRGEYDMAQEYLDWYLEQASLSPGKFLMIDQIGIALQIQNRLNR
jgi:hypothetical protein